MSTMKNKMRFILFLFCIAVINNSCGQQATGDKRSDMQSEVKKNTYSFNDSVNKNIAEGIEVLIKEQKLTGSKKSDLFILLDSDNTNTYIILSDCNECPFSDLVKSTDRFYKSENGLVIPIIFELDFKFSNLLKTGQGNRLYPKIGGYSITFNNKGEIVNRGLVQ